VILAVRKRPPDYEIAMLFDICLDALSLGETALLGSWFGA